MFRHLSRTNRLLALLLPVTFLLGWTACLSVCAESGAPAQEDPARSAQITGQSHETCAGEADGCSITAVIAVNQERQSVKAYMPIRTVVPVSLFSKSRSAWAAPLPEVNQNSPPKLSLKPLFVRFCTFLI